jgi:hypothetical protein
MSENLRILCNKLTSGASKAAEEKSRDTVPERELKLQRNAGAVFVLAQG